MKPGDPRPDPEWRNLLRLRRVERRVPPDVRARVLARSERFLAGRTARHPPAVPNGLSGSPPRARTQGRPWLGMTLVVSVAVAGGAAIALRHLPRSAAPAVTEPGPGLTASAAEPPPPALEAPSPALAPPPARPSSAHRAAPAADLLPAELALLQRARNAYVGRRFPEALALLAEHARRFPRGRLAEEREALRVRSLVASGRSEEARRAAAAFAVRFPRSILLRHPHDGENAFE